MAKRRQDSLADLESHVAQLQVLLSQLVTEKEFVQKENLQLRQLLRRVSLTLPREPPRETRLRPDALTPKTVEPTGA